MIEELLGKVTSRAQIPLAFEAYDIIRRPRSIKIVSTSREAINMLSLKQEGVGDDPTKLKEQIEWRYDWVGRPWYTSREGARADRDRSGTGTGRGTRCDSDV